jgi:hypothetical protein
MRRWSALLVSTAAACSSSTTHDAPRVDSGAHPDAVLHIDAGKPRPDAREGKDAPAKDTATPRDARPDIGVLESTAVLGPLAATPLTDNQTIVPTHSVVTQTVATSAMKPYTPSVLSAWVSQGYGLTTLAAGEPLTPIAPPGEMIPVPGASPSMLLRFVHLPDIQLVDDESPNRVCDVDVPASIGPTDGAFRSQEGDECRILDAAVRTINALNKTLPLSFVLTGGDNADNAQTNEIDWFLQIMDGSKSVKCDSGDYNDPVPGPNNDGKDPFEAVGLDVPWWWVTGNHDILIQGNYVVDSRFQASAVGTVAFGATRDYTQPGAPLFKGPIVPDPRRMPLERQQLMKLVGTDGDGHGVGPSQMASGKAFYSFDVPNSPLRFIILDTPAETGSDDGVVHQADIDSTIKPLFDQALADGKLVIAASHHSTDQITDGSGFGGTLQADALTEAEWEDFLGGYDNLLFYMVGHLHLHRVTYVTPSKGHAFWEIMTGALADFPHELRVVEIWDDDNGWIRMRAILANYQTDNDPVAADGRTLAITDYTSGWGKNGFGTSTDRNVELYIQKP